MMPRSLSVVCALVIACCCSRVAAQVIVLRIDPEAEPVCRAIESQLAEWTPAADPGYFAEAQREGLDPSGDEALQRLVPPLHVRLAVVPMSSGADGATIDLRDGESGASVSMVQVPMLDGQLDWSVLRTEIASRMGAVAASREVASDDDRLALRVSMSGGFGVGSRHLSWPVSGEMWSVSTGAFAAFDLAASFHVAMSDAFALGLDLSYQTSVAAQIDEMHLAGATEQLGIRSNQLAAMFAFVIGGSRFSITPALGYATRGLRPAVHHLLTPSYSLAGPIACLGARVAFTDALALRLVPELQYVLVGQALEDSGVASTGLALGGEVALELAVTDSIALELSGRIAHAWMQTTAGVSAIDNARFATAQVVWQP